MKITGVTMIMSLLSTTIRCRAFTPSTNLSPFLRHRNVNISIVNKNIPRHHSLIKARTIVRSQSSPDSNAESSLSDPSISYQDHVYKAWSLEHDKFLYDNRKESIPKLASTLGRGLNGVQSRLQKLTDVNSQAYARLFVGSKPSNDSHEAKSSKQSSLVPAIEVLRRIRWDTTLSPCDFSVLHYDRVEDTIYESNFNDPNKSVKGQEELFVFAIPEHRISAIKYKERLVWDREKRLDCVFGSMNGNGERIETVLENYDEWKRRKDEEEEFNRLRQIDVSRRLKSVLGDDRFNVLKERSAFLMNVDTLDYEIQSEIQKFVKYALDTFKNANAEINSQIDGTSKAEKSKEELEFMYLFSELVALLPKVEVRECALNEVEIVISRMEGKKTTKTKGSTLPELLEEELDEKFVKGSGAGGQKVNKTSNKVLLLHLPTNLRVECQETRSLTQNRKIARKRLQLKLDEYINGSQSRSSLKAAKAAKNKTRRKSRNKARKKT